MGRACTALTMGARIRGVREVVSALFILIIMAAPMAAVPPASATGSPAAFRSGDAAAVSVAFPLTGDVHGVNLTIGGNATCVDGLLSTYSCRAVDLVRVHGGISQRAEFVGFSPAHGEVLTLGVWNLSLGYPTQQTPASTGPRWPGSPLAIQDGDWNAELLDLYRVALVGALTLPIRAAESPTGSIVLAGTPGTLATVAHANGSRTVVASFANASHGVAFEYQILLGSEGGFPREVILRETSPFPRVLAIATRTGQTLGSGAELRSDLLSPPPLVLDRGLLRRNWGAVPPESGSTDLLLTLHEAAERYGMPAWPRAVGDIRYLSFADYREAPVGPAHGSIPAAGVSTVAGRWFLREGLVDAQDAPDRRETDGAWTVTREMVDEVTVDTVGFSPGSGVLSDLWVPARGALSPRAITLQDAIMVARSLAPYDPGAFEVSWAVATDPSELGTPWESTYTLQCGTRDYASSVFIVVISATTGQLLQRTSWGDDACYVDI